MQFHFKNFKKKFSAFKFSPKLWDKPARTALDPFLRLWSTQTFSALGSSMTSFALVIWAYEQSGSALSTALLSICSYASYVLLSIFAGALSDRWNKKATMLICDAAAALSTVGVLVLLSTDALCVWCVGAVLGWLPIPMNANFRRAVPHPHSREDARPRLRRAQFAAILILQRGALSC